MKTIASTLLVLLLINCQVKSTEEVYICVSPTAKAYHKSKDGCKGLLSCTHKITKVTKDEAIRKYKYRACRIY